MNKYMVENKMKRWQKSYSPAVSLISVAVLLLIWEGICRAGVVSSLFLPPTLIISALIDMIQDGEIGVSLAASLYRILLGFFLGSAFGLLVGLVTGTSALADRMANPIVNALYPIPKIALLPLFILWLGIGEVSKVTIIALGVFFPVAMNTYSGVKNVDTLLIKVAVMGLHHEKRGASLRPPHDLRRPPHSCRHRPPPSGGGRNDCRRTGHRRPDPPLRRPHDYRTPHGRSHRPLRAGPHLQPVPSVPGKETGALEP